MKTQFSNFENWSIDWRSLQVPPPYQTQRLNNTSDDRLSSMNLSSILPQGKKRRVRIDDPISSCDAEIKESIDSDSKIANSPASDDSDDTTWSDGSEQDGSSMIELVTSMLKIRFLDVIGIILRRTCGLEMGVSTDSRTVKNGSSQFSSTNDGRYSFFFPGHRSGGAEVFGTEGKHRGTSTTTHKDKLQIQVAGEMLATVFHRNVLITRAEYIQQILEACPNLQIWQTETSRTVYYLVFTHLSLRVAKATFDLSYLTQIRQGYLPEHLKAEIMWSHRLQLNHKEDLTKAARLVMCLMLNLRDEFLSGKHYWLPYRIEGGQGPSWVSD